MKYDVTDSWGMSTLGNAEVLLIETKLIVSMDTEVTVGSDELVEMGST